ncbi:GyrI-like domain-containing protein [uncultured Flavobacterium sp.]|jgi:effector-binding domain-containing protein|uniref:GyrI-like domain-containing protein n=1 Tax=uncultured Flavobacterium sp. TaxID=165435 RepID=UPI00259426CD|nr:GyrI-like domain-containing protein [uncultured Flavobacterium sp.]
MRILKYIFLLLLLFGVAFVVFVATQPSDYKITRSKEIKVSEDIVLNFVADSTALADWSPWEKSEAIFKNHKATSNDSLSQNITINKEENKSLFKFQKTKKGTLVTWHLSGKLDFKLKMLSVLEGGIDNVIGDDLETGLNNIDNYLVKELTTYNIKVQGLVTKHATNYIQQIDSCKIGSFQKVSKKMLQNMMNFVETNDIKITGLPFIIYNNPNTTSNQLIFSMCVPVEEEILTTEGSEISGGHFDEFLAVKTTLVGDYSHSKEAWDKTLKYIKNKKLIEDLSGKYIRIYKTSLPKERKPSKWITEIYIPVKKKVYRPKVSKPESTEEVAPPSESTTTNPVQ